MRSLLFGYLLLALVGAQQCTQVQFTVSGSAQNKDISGLSFDDLNSLGDLLQNLTDSLPQILATGTQTLAGTFCQPNVTNANNGKLQVLYGSITCNRDVWSAQGGPAFGFAPYRPDLYSWVDYATAQGYPTLALDRLGNGKSSHPDPLLVVQAPYENALYHDLAQQLRAGTTGAISRSFNHLIWVGNSYGSQLGAASAGLYPSDYDEYVLTGFSNEVLTSFAGVSLQVPIPAAIADPVRFAGLPLGYVTSSNEPTRTDSFFGSELQADWDHTNSQLFFSRRDVVSLGQFISVYALPFNGAGFTGRVFVLTGEQDQPFCGPGSSALGPAGCGPLLEETGSIFPDAQYNWKSVNRTGHAIQLFTSSQKVYSLAHQFLAGESFQGGPPA